MKNFAIVRSLDAPGHIALEEFSTYTRRVAARMQAMGWPMPPVLLLHVSESVASVLGVGRTGVIRHNKTDNTGLQSYYEIWLAALEKALQAPEAFEGTGALWVDVCAATGAPSVRKLLKLPLDKPLGRGAVIQYLRWVLNSGEQRRGRSYVYMRQ